MHADAGLTFLYSIGIAGSATCIRTIYDQRKVRCKIHPE